MVCLGIDTAYPALSIALLKDNTILCHCSINTGKTHSISLLPAIDFILKQSSYSIEQLDYIAVDIGPGSFTSLRIGISTARALAQAAQIPLVPVSSLSIMANKLFKSWITNHYQLILMDGKKGRVFGSLFYEGQETLPPFDCTPEELAIQLQVTDDQSKDVLVYGSGLRTYEKTIKEILKPFQWNIQWLNENNLLYPDAQALCTLSKDYPKKDVDEVLPSYIRQSEAEEKWNV